MENCSKTSTTKRMSGLENSGSCFMNRIELEEENSNVYVAITGSNSMEVKIEKKLQESFHKKFFSRSSFLAAEVALYTMRTTAAMQCGICDVRISTSAANRLIGEVVQSRRRPLLGPSPG